MTDNNKYDMFVNNSHFNGVDEQNIMPGIETEIAAIKSQVAECKKVVQQKEEELKLALADLDAYEEKIKKLEELRDSHIRKTMAEGDLHTAIKVFNINGATFNMVRVEGGTFLMGSIDHNSDADIDEKPQHQVALSDFYIGETLVTQTLWQAVMDCNHSYFTGKNLPVDNVSWDDCQEFLKRLSQEMGLVFRLPTEAEWEYAARGGKKSRGYMYAGSNNINDVAWFNDNNGEKTHPIKEMKANELGLYDMLGNLLEWCEDLYDVDYYKNSPERNPCNCSSGFLRVLRGGSWNSNKKSCRVTNRFCDTPDHYSNNYGFRIVLVL